MKSLIELQYEVITGRRLNDEAYSYFARAVRGGRKNLINDKVIVSEMEKYSTVLSKHVVLHRVHAYEREWQRRHPDIDVYHRDIILLSKSKKFVADLTVESAGVGYEAASAQIFGIPSLLFCHEKERGRPTMVIYFDGKTYTPTIDEVLRNKTPIIYFNDKNIREVARREIAEFFNK
jgi:hypothetical protein